MGITSVKLVSIAQ